MGQLVQGDFRQDRKVPTLKGIVELMTLNGLSKEDFNVDGYRVCVSVEKIDDEESS